MADAQSATGWPLQVLFPGAAPDEQRRLAVTLAVTLAGDVVTVPSSEPGARATTAGPPAEPKLGGGAVLGVRSEDTLALWYAQRSPAGTCVRVRACVRA